MQAMRDFLRGSLARALRSAPHEDRLSAALPAVCGSALAAHCAVARLDEEFTLHLQVEGREWLPPLLGMRDVLQHDLARVAGVPLRGLHFQVAGAAQSRANSWTLPGTETKPAVPPSGRDVPEAAVPRARKRRSTV